VFFQSFKEIKHLLPRFTKKKMTIETSTALPYICRYSGSCIMFNMIEACRVAKLQGGEEGEEGDGRPCRNYGGENERMSKVWKNEEEEGNFLIARLIVDKEEEGQGWVVAHQGIHEIFRAPLFVPIVELNMKEKVLSLYLRDHANRDAQHGIKRKFWLKFDSIVELSSFKFAHNGILQGPDSFVNEEKKSKSKEINGDEDFSKKSVEKMGATKRKPLEPALKKRKISAVLSIDAQEEEEKKTVISKKDDTGATVEDKKEDEEKKDYEEKLSLFNEGDGIHDLDDDDEFTGTQNPFAIDDSF